MENNYMLSILINNQWDCPQEDQEVYFDNVKDARKKGVELLHRYNSKFFVIRKITNGHYKTIGYFDYRNEYIKN